MTRSARSVLWVWLAVAGCGGKSEPARVEAKVVDLEQLVAAVRANLGRGALVNVWATW